MNRLGLSQSNLCWRCKTDKGDFLLLFLYCPSIDTYWQRITNNLDTNIILTPALCLLNSMKGNEKIKEKKAQWLKVALITAKKKAH